MDLDKLIDSPKEISVHRRRTITKYDTENWLANTPPSSRIYGEALHKQTTVFSAVGRLFCPFNTLHGCYKSCNDPIIKARPTARRKDLIYTHW